VTAVRREGRTSHYRLNRPFFERVVGGWLENLAPPSPDQTWASSGPKFTRMTVSANSDRWHIRVTVDQFPLAAFAAEDFGHADAHRYRLVAPREGDPGVLKTCPEGEVAAGVLLKRFVSPPRANEAASDWYRAATAPGPQTVSPRGL
jgi:hypothetical protein